MCCPCYITYRRGRLPGKPYCSGPLPPKTLPWRYRLTISCRSGRGVWKMARSHGAVLFRNFRKNETAPQFSVKFELSLVNSSSPHQSSSIATPIALLQQNKAGCSDAQSNCQATVVAGQTLKTFLWAQPPLTKATVADSVGNACIERGLCAMMRAEGGKGGAGEGGAALFISSCLLS